MHLLVTVAVCALTSPYLRVQSLCDMLDTALLITTNESANK